MNRKILALFTLLLASMSLAPSAPFAQELRRAGYLGLQISDAPITGPVPSRGVVIDALVEGGAAQAAGLQGEDIVTHIDGREVKDREDFIRIVRTMRAGDVVRIEGRRGLGPFSVRVPVKSRREISAGLDVFYESVAVDGHKRRTLVAVPTEGKGKRPAVLFVTGLGCTTQEIIDPTDPSASFLYGLARAGFITVRVERPGVGDSEGPACASPEADLESDVRGYAAALKALRKDPRVDADNVFVVGISTGGVEAPLIAAQEPVKGVVVIGTHAKPYYEYLLEARRRQQQLRKTPFDEMDAMLALGASCSYRLLVEKRMPEQILKDSPECAESIRMPAPYTFMQQMAALNMGKAWKAVESPVLVLVGTSDYVAGVFDSPYLAGMINSYQPGRASLQLIEDMDNQMSKASSMVESMNRPGLHGDFHPAVLEAAVDWMRNRAR